MKVKRLVSWEIAHNNTYHIVTWVEVTRSRMVCHCSQGYPAIAR